MKHETRIAAVAGICLSFLASSGTAHHSFAVQFDADKPINLVGTVTNVRWRNPHAWFFIDVEDDGDVVNWGLELASPNLLMRQGWSRASMAIGAEVTVEGFHARDGTNTGNARVVTINSTGKTFSAGSSYTGEDE
jgi:hypothetical protein